MTVLLRRLLAATTLGLALFGAAACADQPQDDPKASSSPTKASALADKKTTCTAYLALDAETNAKASPLAAKFQGADKDPSQALAALVELKTLIADYEAKLIPLAANSADAELKAALDAELVDVRKARADLDAAGVDPVRLQAAIENNSSSTAADKVKTLCAG